MRMMRIRINEIPELLNISKATAYRLIKKHKKDLGETHLRMDENGQFLTEKGLKILASLANKTIKTTSSQSQNENGENDSQSQSQNENMRISNENGENLTQSQNEKTQKILFETFQDQLQKKDEIISNLLDDLRQERHRSDTIIMTLTQQLQTQSKQLEDLRTKKEKITKPKPQSQNLKKELNKQVPESKPTFKQKIIYFFKPHLQRKRA